VKFRWLVDGVEAGFDDQAPYLQNRDPSPSSTDQLNTSLSLEIVDDGSSVDLTTVVIEIDVGGGGFQDAYASSAFVDPYDDGSSQGSASPNGHSFDIVPDTPFPQSTIIQVRVTAEDTVGNVLGPVTYQYTTGVPPYVSLRDPGIGETDVPLADPIVVRVRDEGSGIDEDETQIDVEGVVAYDHDGGGFQPGFAGTYSEVAAGLEYEVSISSHPAYVEGQVIDVRVQTADISGFTLDDTKTFTYRNDPPFVDGQSPAPSEVAPPDTNVFLRIRDLDSGVDLTTVLVEINVDGGGYQTAYTGSTDSFSSPYDGPGSTRTPISDGQSLDIDPSSDFSVGAAIQVRVSASDLAGNVMTPVVYAFEINEGPTIYDLVPPDASTGASTTTGVGFKSTDQHGVDLTSLAMTFDGESAVIAGVAQTGYTLVTTPIADGYEVTVALDADLGIGTTHQVSVSIADNLGVASQTSWSFEIDLGIVVFPSLRAIPLGDKIRLVWDLPAPEFMLQQLFQLRRSVDAAPTTPSQGQLVYEGTSRVYEDTDVETGVRYHYTIFVVRRVVDNVPEYVAYDPRSSDSARLRGLVISDPKIDEYIPAPGEFGFKTTDPLPGAQVIRSWTPSENASLLATQGNRPVLAPVSGVIRKIEDAGNGLKILEFQTTGNLVLSITGILALGSLTVGQTIEVGVNVGTTVPGTVEFEIYRPATNDLGRRTIRPRYFYLTAEKRGG